ncbi:hypothetical protein [Xanthocytophaga agilis]|uniref:hypothetical protein n=1 Tax=Xanthocytophaga agilis TaxID=3048010 RepID=UPI0028D3F66B|nr:hypothetical protein [Xanthocytophaga agilis]
MIRFIVSVVLYSLLIVFLLLVWNTVSFVLEALWGNLGKIIYVSGYAILFLGYLFLMRLQINKQQKIFLFLCIWLGFPSVTSKVTNSGFFIRCDTRVINSTDHHRKLEIAPYGVSALNLIFQKYSSCDSNEVYRFANPLLIGKSLIFQMHFIVFVLISIGMSLDWRHKMNDKIIVTDILLAKLNNRVRLFYLFCGIILIGWMLVVSLFFCLGIERLLEYKFALFLFLLYAVIWIGLIYAQKRMHVILLLMGLVGSCPTISTFNVSGTIEFSNCYTDSERTYTETNPYRLLYVTTFTGSIVDLIYGIQKGCSSEHRKFLDLNFTNSAETITERLIHVLSILISAYCLYLISSYWLQKYPKAV